MSSANLLPLPVLLPLLGAALTLVARRHPRVQVAISIAVLAASLAVAATLMWSTHRDGPIALWLGAWSEPLGIALVADRLSALMLLVSSFVILVVLVFAIGQGVADGDDDSPLAIYFPTYLVLSAGVSNAFLAGDLFNLFVGFEMLLFASFVLLTLGGSGTRIRAGTTYVIVSMVSSFLFLSAIAGVYADNLARLGHALAERDVEHLVFLGDFLHAREAHSPALLHALHAATGVHVPTNEEWHYRPPGAPWPMPWRIVLKWRISNPAGFEGGTKIHVNTIDPWELRRRAVETLLRLRDEGVIAAGIRIGDECVPADARLRYAEEAIAPDCAAELTARTG